VRLLVKDATSASVPRSSSVVVPTPRSRIHRMSLDAASTAALRTLYTMDRYIPVLCFCVLCFGIVPRYWHQIASIIGALSVCLSVFLHDISKTDAGRITKLHIEMFHDEFWKAIDFEVINRRSRVTGKH